MKTANRARRNGGKKATSTQSETTPKSIPGIPPNTLLINADFLGETKGFRKLEFEISEAADKAVLHFSESSGIRNYFKAFDCIFARGLSQLQGRDAALNAIRNLENISSEFAVLMDMVTRSIVSWNKEGKPSEAYMQKIEIGLYHLSTRLEDCLNQNVNAARAALTAPMQ
jgi:hypothetical protein